MVYILAGILSRKREDFEGGLPKKLNKSAKKGKNFGRAGGGGILLAGQDKYLCMQYNLDRLILIL